MTSTSLDITRGMTIVFEDNNTMVRFRDSVLDIPVETRVRFFEKFHSLTDLLSPIHREGDDDDLISPDLFSFLQVEVMSAVYDFYLRHYAIDDVRDLWVLPLSMNDLSSFLDYEMSVLDNQDAITSYNKSLKEWVRNHRSTHREISMGLGKIYEVIRDLLCFPLSEHHHILTITCRKSTTDRRSWDVNCHLSRVEMNRVKDGQSPFGSVTTI